MFNCTLSIENSLNRFENENANTSMIIMRILFIQIIIVNLFKSINFWLTTIDHRLTIDFALQNSETKFDANSWQKNKIISVSSISNCENLTQNLTQILNEKLKYNQFYRFRIVKIWRKIWRKFWIKKWNIISFIDFLLTKSDANSDANSERK